MVVFVFDPGKMFMFCGSLLLLFVSVSAQYTCYINPSPKTKQCDNPCCGTRPNQYCCEKKEEEDNSTLWIIVGCSVGGGLLLLTLVVIVVLCCFIKKNTQRAKIHDGPAGATHTGVNVIHLRAVSPPPAYTYNAPNPVNNTVNNNTGQRPAQAGPSSVVPPGPLPNKEPVSGTAPDSLTFHPPPRYSSLDGHTDR